MNEKIDIAIWFKSIFRNNCASGRVIFYTRDQTQNATSKSRIFQGGKIGPVIT